MAEVWLPGGREFGTTAVRAVQRLPSSATVTHVSGMVEEWPESTGFADPPSMTTTTTISAPLAGNSN